MAERILVVDDETKIVDFVRRGLVYEGYEVDVAYDGESALAQARREPPDLIILDVMLPGLGGLDVCQRLRADGWADLPILMLTARDAVPDRVAGLDAGADDYLVKPFAFDELLARLRALLRRKRRSDETQVLRFGDVVANPATREARRGSRDLSLTAKEFDLMELFLRHPRQVLTRDMIYEHVWGYDFGGESNIIEVYIRYLRSKLEAENEPRILQTVRGVGYALREEP
ncbi:MAG: response regulator transcription factor [Anaerolineae bacterium]|nr:response regulator transcription factor [Anaerolineae bacterium]